MSMGEELRNYLRSLAADEEKRALVCEALFVGKNTENEFENVKNETEAFRKSTNHTLLWPDHALPREKRCDDVEEEPRCFPVQPVPGPLSTDSWRSFAQGLGTPPETSFLSSKTVAKRPTKIGGRSDVSRVVAPTSHADYGSKSQKSVFATGGQRQEGELARNVCLEVRRVAGENQRRKFSQNFYQATSFAHSKNCGSCCRSQNFLKARTLRI